MGINLLPDRVPVSFDEIEEIITERENEAGIEDKEEIKDDENDTVVEENEEALEEETEEPAADKKEKPKKKSSALKPDAGKTPAASSNTPAASTPTASDTAVSYTVVFSYNGSTFATQTVNSGAVAGKPRLQPSASGNWYVTGADNTLTAYDFSTPITADVTLIWK